MIYGRNETVKYASHTDKFHLSLFPIKEHLKISNTALKKPKKQRFCCYSMRQYCCSIFLYQRKFWHLNRFPELVVLTEIRQEINTNRVRSSFKQL